MKDYTKIGRFISLILRHQPEVIGISLDANGWAEVASLLAGLNKHGYPIDLAVLEDIVLTNNKKRYCFNHDKTKIRANQGHSIAVDVELSVVTPPALLYHGTADRFYTMIKQHGLQKRNRNHVHLSPDQATAIAVGKRHGRPLVLVIAARRMHDAGYVFYRSENGVFLTAAVPPQFIELKEI